VAEGGARLAQLRLTLGAKHPFGDGETRLGPPLLLVFEGWDRRARRGDQAPVGPLDPRHVATRLRGADARREAPPLLQRFAVALPGWGGMTVYDRSWYGRVLVERVEGFATEEEWRRAYGRSPRSSAGWRTGRDHREVLAPRQRRGAAEALREALASTPSSATS